MSRNRRKRKRKNYSWLDRLKNERGDEVKVFII